jgi:hypothetical protein
VRDSKQARLLSDPASFKYFEPFVARERSVKAAADELGCNLDTMLYRVKKFLEVGLLEVTRLEQRAGRPIRHYRSVADAFFVPFEVTPYAELEERLETHMQAQLSLLVKGIARSLRERRWSGQRIYRNAAGEVWREGAPRFRHALRCRRPRLPAPDRLLDGSLPAAR